LRIIAGSLGGRNFASPHSPRTHPMSDRIRGALFNTLGDIEGLSLLDAFAGSGAIGFEAVSRGASLVLMIENDKPAQRAIADSLRQLDLTSQAKLIQANCSGWSDNNLQQYFDLVVADPPFDDLQISVLQKLARHVAGGGLYVLSWPGQQAVPQLADDLQLVESKSYGDAQLLFFRRL
jgi:16S rRNA (guanine966-N2)-methyltransferase